MDLKGELLKLELKPTDILVFKTEMQSQQFRDGIERISRALEERLGWRPVIITTTKGQCELEVLTEAELNRMGLQSIARPEAAKEG